MCVESAEADDCQPAPAGPAAGAPPAIAVEPGCIHLLHHRLDLPAQQRARLEAVLSPDERARAARFHFEADRHRAVVTWGLVRTVLGRIVGRAPTRCSSCAGSPGRPPGGGC
jgi:4'-phosphopantetheinyl transferase